MGARFSRTISPLIIITFFLAYLRLCYIAPVTVQAQGPTRTPTPVLSCIDTWAQGDMNCNYAVDDTDYQIWKTAFTTGQAPTAANTKADINNAGAGDGKVDLVDFEIWRENNGKVIPLPTATPTNTPTPNPTNTPIPPTITPTTNNTPIPTATPTNTPTPTATNTPVPVATSTPIPPTPGANCNPANQWVIYSITPQLTSTGLYRLTVDGYFPSSYHCARATNNGNTAAGMSTVWVWGGLGEKSYYRQNSTEVESLSDTRIVLGPQSYAIGSSWRLDVLFCTGPSTAGNCPGGSGSVFKNFTIN